MAIYNRWGEKVFETNNIAQSWDGTYKGYALEIGVYVYYAQYSFVDKPATTVKGNVSLIK
jgi:gliding motility-associated-like protein